MPAMKRPAAAAATKAAPPPKRASVAPKLPPPPLTKSEQVAQAILACEELPESCRAMLVSVLPECLGQGRHALHKQLLTMVEETLEACAVSATRHADAAAATAAETIEKHGEDRRAVESADKAVGEAAESCAQQQTLHASATEAYHQAQAAEATVKQAVAAHAQQLELMSQEKAALQEHVKAKFDELKVASASSEAETTSLVDRCKRFEFDAAVLASLSCVLNKAPDSRSGFDNMVTSQFEEEINKKIAKIDTTLAQGGSERERLECEHKTASEATAAALAAQQARAAEVETEQERINAAKMVATDAAEAALKSGAAAQAAAEAAAALKQQSDDYQAGPIAAFRATVDGEKEATEVAMEVVAETADKDAVVEAVVEAVDKEAVVEAVDKEAVVEAAETSMEAAESTEVQV